MKNETWASFFEKQQKEMEQAWKAFQEEMDKKRKEIEQAWKARQEETQQILKALKEKQRKKRLAREEIWKTFQALQELQRKEWDDYIRFAFGSGENSSEEKRPANNDENLENQAFRELGIDIKKAKLEDIRRARKEVARKHHPDGGGNELKMQRLNNLCDLCEGYVELRDS